MKQKIFNNLFDNLFASTMFSCHGFNNKTSDNMPRSVVSTEFINYSF